MAQVRKIPERRCVGCGEHFPKNSLMRVLRTPEGEIVLDLVGKASGRGAYLCRNATCLKRARKSGKISASLECAIPEKVYDRLESEIKNV